MFNPALLASWHAHGIVTISPAMLHALALAERFASTTLPILLLGATGTGKELFARAIHTWSGRSGRFVDINCGALPRDLVEGELFGHVRGAFTGAMSDYGGLISSADRGTLFLDELTSLPPEAQVKLLRVLDTGRIRRLGESTDKPVDFRVLSAAQPRLGQDLAQERFRLDLLERLARAVIRLPPLEERREDIIHLARYFAQELGVNLTDDAEESLHRYAWPGNVRELKSVIERAAILSESSELDRHSIVEAIALGSVHEGDSRRSMGIPDRFDADTLGALCSTYQWHAAPIAHALGVSRATLFRMLRAKGLSLRHPNSSN